METQSIVVLDFGAQYSQLIARRIREQNVFSVVLPCTASLDEIAATRLWDHAVRRLPARCMTPTLRRLTRVFSNSGLPVLGICYGLQFMVHALGGKVRPADKREYGHAEVEISAESRLFRGLTEESERLDVARRRGLELPPGFQLTAKIAQCCRGNRESREKDVGCAVPSGSPSHSAGN